MSKPTIGFIDAVYLVSIMSAVGYLDVESKVMSTDLALGYNPEQSQQDKGNDNTAYLAILGKDELAVISQEQDEIQQVTKGEVAREDLTEPAKAFEEIADGLEAPGEALEKRDDQQREMDEGIARNASEANLAREIRPADGPTGIAEFGRAVADGVRETGDLVIAGLDDRSDRSADDLRQQAADGAKQIESQAADMQKSNVAFQERIKNEPEDKQTELMADRVKEQEKILTEKAEVAITELARPEPAREDPNRQLT